MNLLNIVGLKQRNLYINLLSMFLKQHHELYMYMDLLRMLLKQQHDLYIYRNILNLDGKLHNDLHMYINLLNMVGKQQHNLYINLLELEWQASPLGLSSIVIVWNHHHSEIIIGIKVTQQSAHVHESAQYGWLAAAQPVPWPP